jgi:hypothetical protein
MRTMMVTMRSRRRRRMTVAMLRNVKRPKTMAAAMRRNWGHHSESGHILTKDLLFGTVPLHHRRMPKMNGFRAAAAAPTALHAPTSSEDPSLPGSRRKNEKDGDSPLPKKTSPKILDFICKLVSPFILQKW